MMRAAIVGCGSLGGVIASRLWDHPSFDLTVVDTDPRIRKQAAAGGLVVTQGSRRTVCRPRFVSDLAGAHTTFDIILLTTKAGGVVDLATAARRHLSPGGFFVAVQNGLVGEDLVGELGPAQVVPGCVLWGASMTAPGEYRITADGGFIMGVLEPRHRADAGDNPATAAAFLSRAFPVRICDDMRGVLWSKLAITASFTALGALTGRIFGDLVGTRPLRRAILDIGSEVYAVSRALGIRLEPLGSGLNIERFLRPGGYPVPVKHLLLRIIGRRHRNTVSSMLASLQAQRPTEVDLLNGLIWQKAQELGLDVPVNRRITEIVHDLEAGAATIGDDLLLKLRSSPSSIPSQKFCP